MKLSAGHQRVDVHPNCSQKCAQQVKKSRVHSNLRGSYRLGISVSPYTEIVLKNVISG